jgi:hypothetical protein
MFAIFSLVPFTSVLQTRENIAIVANYLRSSPPADYLYGFPPVRERMQFRRKTDDEEANRAKPWGVPSDGKEKSLLDDRLLNLSVVSDMSDYYQEFLEVHTPAAHL